jgi:hypothetical protein
MATVSRTLQPQLAEFLYALSASDGADPTRAADTGSESARNGEPEGELGVIRQKDFAWHDQTGAPTDPQAGNIPGGKRDVLRTANFNDGTTQALAPDSGVWSVSSGTLQVASTSQHSDAVAVYQVGDALPSYFEVQASIQVVKPTAGWNANSFIIFDYHSATDFKFAGLDVSTNKLVMGHRDATGWVYDTQASVKGGLKVGTWYNLLLSVNGLTATLVVNNATAFSHTYSPTVVDGWSYGLNWGLVGFGSNNARGAMDNITVQVLPPEATVTKTEDFTGPGNSLFSGGASISGGSFVMSGGRYTGMPSSSEAAISLANLDGTVNLADSSILQLNAKLNTTGRAGFVFDQYSATDYKWAAIDVLTHQVLIGHRQGNSQVIDAAVSVSTLTAGKDYTLGISLVGSTVSVTLDGQSLVGFAYNAVTNDGRFGVFTKGGMASFDTMTVKTDATVAAMTPVLQVAAAPAPADAGTVSTLSVNELLPILEEAKLLWVQALGPSDARLTALTNVNIEVSDLAGGILGETIGNMITIDSNAAGWGWFVDATPQNNSEFQIHLPNGVLVANPSSPASGHMDLLSTVLHELGNVMGFAEDTGADVTGMVLQAGVRRLPGFSAEVAAPVSAPVHAAPVAAANAPDAAAPVIRWDLASAAVGPKAGAADELPDWLWLDDFVNHRGQGAEHRNPNAGIRVQLPTTAAL